MSFATLPDEAIQPQAEDLRAEYGWLEVSSGLGRILLGYAILIGGTMLGLGLVLTATAQMGSAPRGKTPNANLGMLWAFYGGLGILTLVGLYGYGVILFGKFRCLINAPERHNAKWILFACITCILMGPALNVVAGISGVDRGVELGRGPAGVRDMQFTRLGGHMQLAGAVISSSSLILFLLFLRAVARCFEDTARAANITLLIGLLSLLIGGMVVLRFVKPELLLQTQVLQVLAGAWLVAFGWYLYLMMSIRTCIGAGLGQIRSPLESP